MVRSASVGAYGLEGQVRQVSLLSSASLLLLRWRFFSSRTLNGSVVPARPWLAAHGLGGSLRSQRRVVTGEDGRRGHVRAGPGGRVSFPVGGALPFLRGPGCRHLFYWARGG